jgi:hypothetical protein
LGLCADLYADFDDTDVQIVRALADPPQRSADPAAPGANSRIVIQPAKGAARHSLRAGSSVKAILDV